MMVYQTEYMDIKVGMDNGSLVRYFYGEGTNEEVTPKFYRAGGFLYLIKNDEGEVEPIIRRSSGTGQNCNLDSNKYKGD